MPIFSGLRKRLSAAEQQQNSPVQMPPAIKVESRDGGRYQDWINNHVWNRRHDRWCRSYVDKLQYKPTISILINSFNPKIDLFRESLASIFNQVYPFHELFIVDRGSSDPAVKALIEQMEKDRRVKASFQKGAGRDQEAVARIMKKTESEWMLLMGAEDILEPHALFNMIAAMHNTEELDFVFGDSDLLDDSGRRFAPQFKPVWAVGARYPLGYYQHPIMLSDRLIKKLNGHERISALMEEGSLLDDASNHSRWVVQAPGLLYHARARNLKNENPPEPVFNVLVNENLVIENGKIEISREIRSRCEPKTALKLLWVVNDLEQKDEGLLVANFARWLASNSGHQIQTIALTDGPLRSTYENLGPLSVVDRSALETQIRSVAEKFQPHAAFLNLRDDAAQKTLTEIDLPSVWRIQDFEPTAGLFDKAETVVFRNPETAERFRNLDRSHISRVLTAGVDMAEIKLFRQKNSPFDLRKKHDIGKTSMVITTAARSGAENEYLQFIRACEKVATQHPEMEMHFLILDAANGGEMTKLNDAIAASSQASKFKRIADSTDVTSHYEYLWITDIYVSCARDESIPVRILEAMAFQKAVIASDQEPLRHIVEDGGSGYLIPYASETELAARIEELATQTPVRDMFGRTGQEIAREKYHMKKVGGKLEDLLRESIVYLPASH